MDKNSSYPTLPPSGIGEASKYNFSPWYIKMRFQDKSLMEDRRWNVADSPLSPLQLTIGDEFEDSIYEDLEEGCRRRVDNWYDWDNQKKNNDKIIDSVRKHEESDYEKPTMLTQVRLAGQIGAFDVMGDADLVLIFSTEKGAKIQVIDIKSSWEEKPSQQLQSATYSYLVRDILSDTNMEYEICGGILFRETDISKVLDQNETPGFHTETRESDVQRVLREGGPFTFAFSNPFQHLSLDINKNSPYSEVSAVESIEKSDLSALGISQGEKSKLESFGITDIEDVASLYKPMSDAKPYNYEEPDINPKFESVIREIQETSKMSTKLSTMSQKAQAILGEINPNHEYAHTEPWMPWLPGSGNGNLPEDNPPYDSDMDIRENSMIRVYLNVQYDHIRDCICAVSGVVTSGIYDGEALEFSVVDDQFVRDPTTWHGENEVEFLEESVKKIYKTVKFLADFAGHGMNSAMHLYFYSREEYDNFYDCIRRNTSESVYIESMRDILDSRRGISQSMTSIVEEEITNRMSVKDMDTSVPSIINKTFPNHNKQEHNGWDMIDESGDKVNLKQAFNTKMFDGYSPIDYSDGDTRILNRYKDSEEPDNFFRIVPRSGAQIPIEYLWSTTEVGIFETEWVRGDDKKQHIESYMWVNKNKKDKRMSTDHYKAMSRKLAQGLYHIERSLVYRNPDIDKKEVSIADIEARDTEELNLADSCFDYLDLESEQTKRDAIRLYSKPSRKRVLEGESVPMIVTEEIEDKGYMFKVRGQLLFDEFGFESPDEVAGSSKISGSDSTSGGSRCVATPLVETNSGYETAVSSPNEMINSTKVSVEDYSPEKGQITIKGYRTSYDMEFRYIESRIPWTLDAGDSHRSYVGPGQALILDASPDNMMAEKSIKALNNASNNKVYQDIDRIRKSGDLSRTESKFTVKKINDYISFVEPMIEFSLNNKQKKFVKQIDRYSLLQGPPGTGKTSGGLAHGILSRAYDLGEQNKSLTALVTGLSNKSVDEVMNSVSEVLDSVSTHNENPLENVRLVRLSSSPSDPISNVEYVNYRSDKGKKIIRGLLSTEDSKQTELSSAGDYEEHTIFFSTPGKIDGLMDCIDNERDAQEVYANADDLFDLLAVDEASMMPLYQMMMVTPFLKPLGQLLLSGDHRQLPPVRKYDWSEERRKSIIRDQPHLSVLDYFRYLRGDQVDEVYDNSPPSPNADIPITRLEETYRCHKDLTEFLRKTVYTKDGIRYHSNRNQTLSGLDSENDTINKILRPDCPVTLIIHDDKTSQQHNVLEEEIISKLSRSIPENADVGVVTPHNAQKGRLEVSCPNSTVNTVEKFQGGEKDVMFISTTVSDPDYLSKEEDFILSENRLTVALSRMKKMLVVVAPMSVFRIVPDDKELYNEARIWKSLYNRAGADGRPDWTGRASDIHKSIDIENNIWVYR